MRAVSWQSSRTLHAWGDGALKTVYYWAARTTRLRVSLPRKPPSPSPSAQQSPPPPSAPPSPLLPPAMVAQPPRSASPPQTPSATASAPPSPGPASALVADQEDGYLQPAASVGQGGAGGQAGPLAGSQHRSRGRRRGGRAGEDALAVASPRPAVASADPAGEPYVRILRDQG